MPRRKGRGNARKKKCEGQQRPRGYGEKWRLKRPGEWWRQRRPERGLKTRKGLGRRLRRHKQRMNRRGRQQCQCYGASSLRSCCSRKLLCRLLERRTLGGHWRPVVKHHTVEFWGMGRGRHQRSMSA